MLVSSCLVLTALTATGLYVKNVQEKEQEDNVIDFSTLENQADAAQEAADELADLGELDYDPSFYEADSSSREDQGLNMLGSTAGQQAAGDAAAAGGAGGELAAADGTGDTAAAGGTAGGTAAGAAAGGAAGGAAAGGAAGGSAEAGATAAGGAAGDTAAAGGTGGELAAADDAASGQASADEALAANASDVVAKTGEEGLADAEEAMDPAPVLDFTEGDMLTWPIVGNVLVNYSMDKTVYFATLQQYQYNPAIIIAATEGEGIAAAADGQVTEIYQDPETGTTVVMNLGDGYELTYGQLTDLTVAEGDVVTTGEVIGKVAAPTMYYSVEGSNVYFKLTKDGQPVNPMSRLS